MVEEAVVSKHQARKKGSDHEENDDQAIGVPRSRTAAR
jgi:hypothetical protein